MLSLIIFKYKLYNFTNLMSLRSLFGYRLDNLRMGFDFQQGQDIVTYTVRSESRCSAVVKRLVVGIDVAVEVCHFTVFSFLTAVEVQYR
jgi:hypothetical protein